MARFVWGTRSKRYLRPVARPRVEAGAEASGEEPVALRGSFAWAAVEAALNWMSTVERRVRSRREDFARVLRTGTAICVRETPAMLTRVARDGRGKCGRLVQSVLGTDQERSIAAVLGSFI